MKMPLISFELHNKNKVQLNKFDCISFVSVARLSEQINNALFMPKLLNLFNELDAKFSSKLYTQLNSGRDRRFRQRLIILLYQTIGWSVRN